MRDPVRDPMKKTIATLLLATTLITPAAALDVNGVSIPDQLKVGTHELQLQGAGMRSKWFLDLYVSGLYTSVDNSSAASVLAADKPQAIRLHITSGLITSKRMIESTMEGFRASTHDQLAPIETQIDNFMAAFKAEIHEGDIFDLIYVPGEGVNVVKNGTHLTQIPGLAFKQALFGIWLSDQPAQKNLKAEMLGR